MTNFLLIIFCMGAGYVLRKTKVLPEGSHLGINGWLLYVALPAVTLKYVPTIVWSPQSLVPLLSPLVVWLGAVAFVAVFGTLLKWDRATRTALILTGGLANTSFVGFPLIQAWYGTSALPVGVLCDQASFLLLTTLGVATAGAFASGGEGKGGFWFPVRAALTKVFTFPSTIAFAAALVLPRFVDLSPALPLLSTLGDTLAPLALFSVGLQLSFGEARAGGTPLVLGLAYKLVLAPLVVFGLVWVLGLRGLSGQIPVFEAAMAPMITAAVVAGRYGAAPKLANAMVGMGIAVSLGTTALWWLILTFLG